MISVDQAQQLVASNTPLIDSVKTPLLGAIGRVLREDIRAERDAPPFNRATMDGIAIAHGNGGRFTISGIARAGAPILELESEASCMEIMTGAIIPSGADTVIPYEELTIESGVATISNASSIVKGQNINEMGSHHCKEEIVLKKGAILRAPQVGIVASEGASEVEVSRLPSIAIVNTGDELVELNSPIEEYQIRISNKYSLHALFAQRGLTEINHFHINDDREKTISELERIIEGHDVCILSGGVSKGKFDYVPEALEELGVQKVLHRIAQKPGKPMWFGKLDSKLIFGLPGNPISTLVCARRYVIPAIEKMQGQGRQHLVAKLHDDVVFNKELTYFVPVKVEQDSDCTFVASPIDFKGSGNYSALAMSDGILELPHHKNLFHKGEEYPLYLWKGIEEL